MNRVLWIWLPDWTLQRLAIARPELDRHQIVLYEPHARGGLRVVAGGQACGIRPGMPLAEAAALGEVGDQRVVNDTAKVPDPCSSSLCLLPHDPVADRTALEELALWCERFSPAVAIESAERPDGLALDVTGLGPLFGGEAALAERVVREFHQRGLSVRVAIADTLGAAWAVAHFEGQGTRGKGQGAGVPALAGKADRAITGQGGNPTSDLQPPLSDFRPLSLVPPGATFSALAPLPVEALRLSEETLALLSAVGIRTVEQLAALPRASLSARFGPQLLEQLDRATGEASELLVPHRPAPEFSAAWDFESPTEHVEAIEQVLEELLQRVCASLAARGEGALGFVCRIDSADRERMSLPIGMFRPSASAKHLGELLRLRLETIRLESPVAALAIEVTAVAPLRQQQQELFIQDRCREAPRYLAALVERLSSRLGREAVVRPALLPDAQPEYASVDLPWTGQERGRGPGVRGQGKQGTGHWGLGTRTRKRLADRVPRSQSLAPSRPIWLADPPLPIAVISVIPDSPPAQFHYTGIDYRIAHAWGPERIETGWWRKLGAGARAVMARSPDRAMTSTEGLPLLAGDLWSAKWHGRTQRVPAVPQRGAGIRRDYYRIETNGGHRFWIFRRLSDARWFLHGTFG
jgi:protein ImuB